MKFSIILPVYNGEVFVRNAIKSVINQSYENFELIICNDDSADQTDRICQEYAQKEKRIKLVDVNFHNVAQARNEGLRRGTGDYLVFIDADDCMANDFLEEMYQLLSRDTYDYIICQHTESAETFYHLKSVNASGVGKRYDVDKFLAELVSLRAAYRCGTVWAKVFKTDIVKKNNLQFDPFYTVGEDTIFVLEYLKYVTNVYIMDKIIYYYNINRANSLSKRYCSRYCEIQYHVLQAVKVLLDMYNIVAADEIYDHMSRMIAARCKKYDLGWKDRT